MNSRPQAPGDKAIKPEAERDPKPVSGEEPSPETPPGGPHAKPELTNEEATPGAGLLPDPNDPDDALNSTGG